MIREWFSLDGVRCHEMGIALVGYTLQPIPDQEMESIEIPGMNGTYDLFSGAYKKRQIIIRCAQLSVDERGLADSLMRIKDWVSGKRKLMLWDRPGIEYDASFFGSSNVDNQALWGEFELIFSCAPAGRGFERPVQVGGLFSCGGNTQAPCILDLTLIEDSNGIKIFHAGGAVIIDGEMRARQALVVDGVKRYVALGGVGIMPRVSIQSDWPIVSPGSNTITANVAISGTVRFSERWI